MNITRILTESYDVAKRNPLIFVPVLVASVFSVLFSLITVGSTIPMLAGYGADPATMSPDQMAAGLGSAMSGVFLVSVVTGIVYLLAHGMTVAMADLALRGQSPSLKDGWSRLLVRIVPIIASSVLVGILVGIGMLLLVLPGIVVAFLLMYTLVSVMVDESNAAEALVRSFRAVTKHFRATGVVFLVLIALAVLSGIVTSILGGIPALGAILAMVVSAAFTGYATIFMLRSYRELNQEPGPTPDVEV